MVESIICLWFDTTVDSERKFDEHRPRMNGTIEPSGVTGQFSAFGYQKGSRRHGWFKILRGLLFARGTAC